MCFLKISISSFSISIHQAEANYFPIFEALHSYVLSKQSKPFQYQQMNFIFSDVSSLFVWLLPCCPLTWNFFHSREIIIYPSFLITPQELLVTKLHLTSLLIHISTRLSFTPYVKIALVSFILISLETELCLHNTPT